MSGSKALRSAHQLVYRERDVRAQPPRTRSIHELYGWLLLVPALALGAWSSCILERSGLGSGEGGAPSSGTMSTSMGSGGAAPSSASGGTPSSGGAGPSTGGQGGATPNVGDCQLDGEETCDDCNQVSGDGCDEQGQIEPGWACPQVGELCMAVTGIVPGVSSVTALIGESNPANFESACPPGQLLVGVEATNSGDWPNGSDYLSYVTPLCATARMSDSGDFTWTGTFKGTTYGGVDDCCVNNVTAYLPALCPQDRFAVGFTARATSYVTTLSLQCAPVSFDGQAVEVGAPDHTAGPMGSNQGGMGSDACGLQAAAAALIGKAGAVLDNVGLRCDELSFSLCGDSVMGPAEACEDGNSLNGDGCSAKCEVE